MIDPGQAQITLDQVPEETPVAISPATIYGCGVCSCVADEVTRGDTGGATNE